MREPQTCHTCSAPAKTLLAIAALSLTCLAVTVLNLRGGRWWE